MSIRSASRRFINNFIPVVRNPYLPQLTEPPTHLTAAHTRKYREKCGPQYRQACLEYAQSLWLQGKPAQALLQLNKSAFAEPSALFPYEALIWFLENRREELFLGNPVRHFQHLATRIAGPRAEIRKWQAWACFHLSRATLPPKDFPEDFDQQKIENIHIPTLESCLTKLTTLSSEKEATQVLAIFRERTKNHSNSTHSSTG